MLTQTPLRAPQRARFAATVASGALLPSPPRTWPPLPHARPSPASVLPTSSPPHDPSDPTRPAPAGSNEALPAFSTSPGPPCPRDQPRPRLQRPYRFPEAAAAAPPRVSADPTGERPPPPGSGALGEGCCQGPLGCPPAPLHLAGRLARAPANRTDPPSPARARAQYVAGGERKGAGTRRKSVLSLRLTTSKSTQQACAAPRGGGLTTPQPA